MTKHFGRVFSAQPTLLDAHIITVEADYSQGLHAFSVVGLPDKAIEESRDRVSAALKNSGFSSPKHTNRKVIISLAPAAIKKEGTLFDTPIALSYLLAAEEIEFDTTKKLFIGELGLDGASHPVHGVLPITKTAHDAGFDEVYVPTANAAEAAMIDGITVYGYSSLEELIRHINKKPREDSEVTCGRVLVPVIRNLKTGARRGVGMTLDDIQGQAHAKRGLTIAASGAHNIAFYGPPGTGKTMLATALGSILPELTHTEMIAVHSIHSVAGSRRSPDDSLPPIRSPHHTSSHVALVGGGTIPKPGEVTLAHHGVLFLDEFPEFDRRVINALREPLEAGVVSISRAKGSVQFPSQFILVAALNPCPCGYAGSERCTCTPFAVTKYQQKISGPIIDRIDMWIEVSAVAHETLFEKRAARTDETGATSKLVKGAREMQAKRYSAEPFTTNSGLSARKIHMHIPLSERQKQILVKAADSLKLSPRGVHRTMRLARTIADLAASSELKDEHLLEALQFRPKN